MIPTVLYFYKLPLSSSDTSRYEEGEHFVCKETQIECKRLNYGNKIIKVVVFYIIWAINLLRIPENGEQIELTPPLTGKSKSFTGGWLQQHTFFRGNTYFPV